MPQYSVGQEPIRHDWWSEEQGLGMLKEVAGTISLFHWHCGTPRRRVIKYQKTDEGVKRIGCTSWICQVCEKREYPSVF